MAKSRFGTVREAGVLDEAATAAELLCTRLCLDLSVKHLVGGSHCTGADAFRVLNQIRWGGSGDFLFGFGRDCETGARARISAPGLSAPSTSERRF